jgi:tetratricopeptide (TPR) repeat protein
MLKKTTGVILLFFVFTVFNNSVMAQPAWTIDPFGKEKKPEKYENRKLGSEKTADKKFTRSRHFIQNSITHYNYYFNSNNKLNAVVERASLFNKDDYSKLLSFYPYSLENTATQKQELDSIIYKCTAGILLHDLRNDWIDNLYLLIGKAYYYQKVFDSAGMTFQFINYNLFPRKKKEDDNRVVGTNTAASGSVISIANKEKRNIVQKAMSLPPSRNDALLWLARTLIEQDEFGESAGLLNTLQNDPNLPERLHNDLDEVNAYWYFKQLNYDSAAVYIEKALSNAYNKEDKARREFLLAQLYEMTGRIEKASEYYGNASKHTTDPLMDIYARLNDAKMYRSGDNIKALENSIEQLLKLAKKDKFEGYRDIIYYSAGILTLQKPDSNTAIIYFDKSVEYNENNIPYKNKAYLKLGDIAYNRKLYKLAANMYDSLQLSDSSIAADLVQIETRRAALTKIVEFINTIDREDSLQRIAALAPAERDALVKKMVKKLRKENGLKEDAGNAGTASNVLDNKNNPPADLFATAAKGEWYFYNSALKSRGYADFKSKWGTRINVDNWRRKAAVDNTIKNGASNTSQVKENTTETVSLLPAEINFESLMKQLPTSPEKIDSSNKIWATTLLKLAKLYQNELEDYEEAIKTYEQYLQRFPAQLADGEIYLGLYYWYKKTGNIERAEYYKKLLNSSFPNSKSMQLLNTPASVNDKTKNPEATKLYNDIYSLFIEGRFVEAISKKNTADRKYGVSYWTPQLLYIESLYNVRECNDSIAIAGLNKLIQDYPGTPLKDKAETMISVLKRRKEIEIYLTELKVTRAEEDTRLMAIDDAKPVATNAPAIVTAPPIPVKIPLKPVVEVKDTLKAPPPLTKGAFVMHPEAPHTVIMILEKVDGVYVNEAKNAFTRYNKENYYGQQIDITKEVLDADRNLLIISSFVDGNAALLYCDKIKRSASREVSWLPANKYSFLIITNENLQVLKTNKDINSYKALLNTQYPGKF